MVTNHLTADDLENAPEGGHYNFPRSVVEMLQGCLASPKEDGREIPAGGARLGARRADQRQARRQLPKWISKPWPGSSAAKIKRPVTEEMILSFILYRRCFSSLRSTAAFTVIPPFAHAPFLLRVSPGEEIAVEIEGENAHHQVAHGWSGPEDGTRRCFSN